VQEEPFIPELPIISGREYCSTNKENYLVLPINIISPGWFIMKRPNISLMLSIEKNKSRDGEGARKLN
jgi:hypothetical protein